MTQAFRRRPNGREVAAVGPKRPGEILLNQEPTAGPRSAIESEAHVYGVEPVLEVLRAGNRPVEQILVSEGASDHRLKEVYELARNANVPVRRVKRSDLVYLLGGVVKHQGVVARVAAARYANADQLIDSLVSRIGTDDAPLAVALDGIQDPHNLGAVLRTAECVGAHAVFIPERRSVGLTETVAKVAAGALEHVPVARVPNLTRLIERFKELGIWTVGASANSEIEYTGWDFGLPTVLFLGNEGSGLHRLVRERCDVLVRIPLRGKLGSLNVSVSAGVILYEALRQRSCARKARTTDQLSTLPRAKRQEYGK